MPVFKLAAAVALGAMAGAAVADDRVATLAEFPSGTFLENLIVAEDDVIIFTSYFARQLKALGIDNGVSDIADLPAHPVGLLRVDEFYVVTAHGTPFTDGEAFTQTQQILMLGADGAVSEVMAVDDALFLNGMVELPQGPILIADSIAGTIWQLDLEARKVSPWLQHELLTQNPDLPVFAPGANGLKLDGDRLLVSNSGRGALYEVAINEEGRPASAPLLKAETGAIDDFWVEDGRIVFTTHGEALQALEPDGSITTLLTAGCDGCTSVARRGDDYIVLTTGGLLEGRTEPARILAVPVR